MNVQKSDYPHEVKKRIKEAEEMGLIRLDLNAMGLTRVPLEVFNLTHLQLLDLRNNFLEELPGNISLLANLTELRLRGNRLTKIPVELCGLTKLKYLQISDNRLKELPDGLGLLSNLEIMDLNSNSLKKLPKSFFKLKSLKRLFLKNNKLRVLPKEVAQLSNLVRLDLRNNQTRRIPKEITFLESLENLGLSGNPFEIPPQEIVERGIDAIRNYFKELVTHDFDFLYEAKLLLVGQGRVGKTSLVKSLTVPTYQLGDHATTEGIDITQWTISKDEISLEKDFRLNIWDFGGQEIYHSTHQFFLTKRSIYLLVTEARKDENHEDFYYWLNIIRLLGDKSPVIIVQNKCDQPYRDIPIQGYRRIFNTIVGHQKVSCLPEPEHRHSIETLRFEIRKLIEDKKYMPHIGTPLPSVWVDIRNELEGLKQSGYSYISRREYLEICRENGMDEERAIYLSEFFHDLGVFLHFHDDWELRDTIYLDYEWVTSAVYKVLDNETVKNKKGEFVHLDLLRIWKEKKFQDKRREMLSLMKRFELCFELEEGRYLAPQLLPADEVDFQWNSETANLHFEYRYKFMPKGILQRLIVKMNRHIHENILWKYGVLIEYGKTRALIKEHYFYRKITIQLEGEDKRGLLNKIRRTIRKIHNDFSNLEVEEMIPCNCPACRDNAEPHFFKYEALKRRLDKNKPAIDCDESLEEINILELLGEVITPMEEPLRVFVSYSHKDQSWLNRVHRHLKPLEREGKIDLWSDKRIKPGEPWKEEIFQALMAANVALLLISADFFASDFIIENELPALLEQAKEKGTKVISLILKPSRFERDKILSQFETANNPQIPLIQLREYDQEHILAKLAETIEDYR